jgi:hypothetical protein
MEVSEEVLFPWRKKCQIFMKSGGDDGAVNRLGDAGGWVRCQQSVLVSKI